jgi:hypothetical protein
MAGGTHGEGLRGWEAPDHVSAAGRALGLLLSRALSSRLLWLIVVPRRPMSSMAFPERIIDGKILLYQREAARQGLGGLLRC